MRAGLIVGACLLSGCGLERAGLGDFSSDAGGAVASFDSGSPPPSSSSGGGVVAPDGGHVLPDSGGPDAPVVVASDGSTPIADATAGSAPDAIAPGGPPDATTSDDDAEGETAGPGDALQFANGAYVEVGTLPIPNDFTLEAWVNPASVTGEMEIVAEDHDTVVAGQFRLGLSAGKPFFMMSDPNGDSFGLFGAAGYAFQAAQALPVGVWSHVAVTKSGASFVLFVGGAQAATFTAMSAFNYAGPATPFRIAARVAPDGTSVDSPLSGVLDEVRVWNVARSAAEIAANMSQTVNPTDPTLTAYWRFDDGSGLTASDEVGRSPATLVGGPVWVTSTAF